MLFTMEKQYKTFDDLVFKDYVRNPDERMALMASGIGAEYLSAKQATLKFKNGYMISVLFGSCFYSDGIDTYEVAAIKKGGGLYYGPPFKDDVEGYVTRERVTEIMKAVQDL